jgi:2-polyprenyl-6-methoxyphenol hydroxylase-like FAD-dependent oxidoreductase
MASIAERCSVTAKLEMSSMRNTDIAIVGCGLAGSTAAAMLERAGRDFVVIDPDKVYPWDFRCEKLDPSQIELLRKTGLVDTALSVLTQANQSWMVRLGRFIQKLPTQQVGFYYDALVNRLRQEVPSKRFAYGKVASITTSADRQTVVLSNGEEISARLVVLATGPNNALRKSLGIERKVVSACHSVSIGFEVRPVDRERFGFSAMTYFPDDPSYPIAYLTLFPIGDAMRANLFVYRALKDPWFDAFRKAPKAACLADMPGLRTQLEPFEIVGTPKVRPIDLYETTGHRQAGVVVVGDAFSSSCPAAGTGANKVFMDVGRLCNVYVPQWLATAGMDAEKIGAFYDDADKRACDEQSMTKALDMRALAVDRSLHWRFQRVVRRTRGVARGVYEFAMDRRRSLPFKPAAAKHG